MHTKKEEKEKGHKKEENRGKTIFFSSMSNYTQNLRNAYFAFVPHSSQHVFVTVFPTSVPLSFSWHPCNE